MSLLGFAASSTIVPMSAVGRLSTTNQPRSSSTSATPDRPAPDKPVIKTTSATGEPYRSPAPRTRDHAPERSVHTRPHLRGDEPAGQTSARSLIGSIGPPEPEVPEP